MGSPEPCLRPFSGGKRRHDRALNSVSSFPLVSNAAEIALRRFGAEHPPVGTVFDFPIPGTNKIFKQQFEDRIEVLGDANLLSNRCISCAVDKVAEGQDEAPSLLRESLESTNSTLREMETMLREEQEQRRVQQLRDRLSLGNKLAKKKREEYHQMFRNDKTKLKPITPWRRDNDLSLPPPPQLNSLLPVSVQSKVAFQSTVREYRKARRKLKRIHAEAVAERKAMLELQAKLLRDKQLREKHERLVGLALKRMKNRKLFSTFSGWNQNVRKQIGFRNLVKRCFQNQKKIMFEAWVDFIKSWKIEKECGAVVIQATVRRLLAQKTKEQLTSFKIAATKITAFFRACLAKNILRIMKRKMEEHEALVRKSLLRMMKNLEYSAFTSWRNRVTVMKHVRRMAGNSRTSRMQECWTCWIRYKASSKRERKRTVVETIHRVGRGFLGRLEAKRIKRKNKAAQTIQCFVRIVQSRKALRQALRQRRMIKRKLKRMLADRKTNSFASWKLFTKTSKVLKLMIEGSRIRDLRFCFKRWESRRIGAIDIQRVYRGYCGRCIFRPMQLKALQEAKEGTMNMALLFDDKVTSERLIKLRMQYDQATHSTKEVFDLDVNGTLQRFSIKHHRDYILSAILKEIEKEIIRIKQAEIALREQMKREASEWHQTLKDFVGKARLVRLDDFHTYANAGKSFDLHFNDETDVEETILSWRDMYEKGYITRWIIISWMTEAMLMRKGIRAAERNMIWDVIKESFGRDLLQDLAAFILARIAKNSNG